MQAPNAGATLSAAQQAAADTGAKVMMPVGDGASQPFLDFALSALADAGCTEVCLVVGPAHDKLRAHYAPSRCARLRVHFAVQASADGTAAAVAAAGPVVGTRPFLVVNGDNLYPRAAIRALVELDGCGLSAFTRASLVHDSGFDVDRVARFATVDVDDAGWLTDMHEKPPARDVEASGPDALISMNLWRFDQAMLAACRDVSPSPRSEYELPDAVRLAVARGTRMRVLRAHGAVLDLTSRADIQGVSHRLTGVEPRL